MEKRILITGGAGFIGSNLVNALFEKEQFEILVLDDFSTGRLENIKFLKDKITIVQGSILNESLIQNITQGIDIIFHLAASVGNIKSIESPQKDAETNLIGSLILLQAAKKNKIKRIIYSSSAACFGDPNYLPIDEQHTTNPSSPYGISKLAAEKNFLCYSKMFGIKTVCLRYFNVYGENQFFDAYGNVIPIFIQNIIQKQPLIIFGDGNQTRDFIHVSDVVQANILGMNSSVSTEVLNIGTGTKTSINELIKILSSLFQIKININHSQPRNGEVVENYADINKATNILGFRPKVELINGLEKYIAWYLSGEGPC